jgi:hypothetical protein
VVSLELEVAEARSGPRYSLVTPMSASFSSSAVTLLNIASAGALIEHRQPIRLNSTGRLALTVPDEKQVRAAQARILWSRLSARTSADGKQLYRSGLQLIDDVSAIESALGVMVTRGLLVREDDSLEKKRHSLVKKLRERSRVASVRLITPSITEDADRVLMVQHAIEQLRVRPEEATRWYNRAKFSLAEGSAGTHRDEVLAVWEYLDRSVPLEAIRAIFDRRET